ncbi:DL-methionine transporter substrate-binding subunit [Pokkaliibacter plantistimulans]|uniref:Lipoprotein n=1 Tax=Pokkaliibacter plantistimulans TaxID=1635171 RepID=A0ABX5M7Z3_9GAMM|nr:MetQ/NlpA family ABC transporter substrate-binding protein [Pokkaliibacter plantistimulans]PXF33015.1 DL-methionine transporter substrate-binding subunit [Pokkaliibacter plantistimulans]
MSNRRTFIKTVAAAAVSLLVWGQAQAAEPLKVGVMAGPESQVMETAAAEAKKRFDVDVKLIEFSDYVAPNVALADGSIDANAFQHRPYLDAMVRDRGFKLVAVANTFVYPIAAYSKKIKNISELPEGAQIAIPNDPSNEGRVLILLDKQGLIKLEDNKNLEATPLNIAENPKKFKFVELDAAQLPRALDDVDLAFINNTYAVPAGLLPTRDGVLVEDKDSPYVNVFAAREDNQNDPRLQKLIEAYQSEAVAARAEELFKGTAIPGWK